MIANGFLPTRGSLMLDFVSVAMLAVTLVLIYSIYEVRFRRNMKRHRIIQISTFAVLTVALILFEIDMRFFTDWREIAEPSPFYQSGVVDLSLWLHLAFAIPTPIIWIVVITMAIRKFRTGISDARFSKIHRVTGRIAAAMMLATSITGWGFYYVAFVA